MTTHRERTRRRAVVLLLAGSLAETGLRAQVVGDELRANTHTADRQLDGAVAVARGGGFVVVWASEAQDGSGYGIFGQRFGVTGGRVGGEFAINTYTTWGQLSPAVAAQSSGDFVVVWSSYAQDGSGLGVFGQRFDGFGVPQGGEFRVNSYTTADQLEPSVSAGGGGGFVVAWNSYDQDGSGGGIYARRYDAAGLPLGSEFRVNNVTLDSQWGPAVAVGGAGEFVVAWSSYDDYGSGIFGRLFDAAGVPAGPQFEVHSGAGSYYEDSAAVAMDETGDFVVAWQSFEYPYGLGEVVARRFDDAGLPQGPDFQVNTYTTYIQGYPQVAANAAGEFVVVWESQYQDGSDRGIFGQRFDAAGVRKGDEFQVNAHTLQVQRRPAIGADAAGRFVAAWGSFGQDGSDFGVYARRIRLALFADGFETGDTSRWSSAVP